MGQRVAVQKQQWWPVATMAQPNLCAASLDVGQRKARHDFHGLFLARATWRALAAEWSRLNPDGREGETHAPAWAMVGPSPASRVCLMSRASLGSKRRPRCIVERLSHITRSLTRQACE